MPFTATHPLAVVPLIYAKRLRLDTTCLVIGSMSPDFEYFTRVKLVNRIGHTVPGLFLWCVPITIACAVVFHHVVKHSAVRVLPDPLARRFAAVAARPWMPAWSIGAAVALVISALIGAITHDVWDSFTHRGMWGVNHIPALSELYVVPVLGLLPLHRVLQHGCTIVGSVILTAIIWRALRRVTPLDVEQSGRWRERLVWLVCVASLTLAAYAKMVRHHETDPGSLVVAPCCGLLGGAFAAGVLLTAYNRRLRRRQP